MENSDRSSGTTVAGIAAEDLARAVAEAQQTRTGREPSRVICRLERRGCPPVPGPAAPDPGADSYVEGGDITRRHRAIDGRLVSAVQIETAYPGLGRSPTARARLADTLAEAPFR